MITRPPKAEKKTCSHLEASLEGLEEAATGTDPTLGEAKTPISKACAQTLHMMAQVFQGTLILGSEGFWLLGSW